MLLPLHLNLGAGAAVTPPEIGKLKLAEALVGAAVLSDSPVGGASLGVTLIGHVSLDDEPD